MSVQGVGKGMNQTIKKAPATVITKPWTNIHADDGVVLLPAPACVPAEGVAEVEATASAVKLTNAVSDNTTSE